MSSQTQTVTRAIAQTLVVAVLVVALGVVVLGPFGKPGQLRRMSEVSGPPTSVPSASELTADGQLAPPSQTAPSQAPPPPQSLAPPSSKTAADSDGGGADAGKPEQTDPDLSDPASLTVVVNKQRPLDPIDYAPDDLVHVAGTSGKLRRPAARHLAQLLDAADSAGVNLRVDSLFRSYRTQQLTYEGWVAKLGRRDADDVSARPGYSEHQTGLAVDVLATGSCWSFDCFEGTPEAKWLRRNAHTSGFIVRYQKGSTATTGYSYEPWHLRYVGVKLAQTLRQAERELDGPVTLEEHFGLPAAPRY